MTKKLLPQFNPILICISKLAEFICEIVLKSGDYTIAILEKFKGNLIAIFGFLFTVILANIVLDQPLDNVFTYDITIVLEAVLFSSAIYLMTCIFEINHKMKRARKSYDALKKNYDPLLSPADVEEAFNNDELINEMETSVRRKKR